MAGFWLKAVKGVLQRQRPHPKPLSGAMLKYGKGAGCWGRIAGEGLSEVENDISDPENGK